MGENAASRKMTSRFLNEGEQVRQGGKLLLLRTGRVRDCFAGPSSLRMRGRERGSAAGGGESAGRGRERAGGSGRRG